MSGIKLECLRCGTVMNYARTEKLQLGERSWLFGDLPNLIAGAMSVDVFTCPTCGKIEFYQAMEGDGFSSAENDFVPQKKCPKCGKMHDFDYPKCPFCKYEY